jgi:hypothetical protein
MARSQEFRSAPEARVKQPSESLFDEAEVVETAPPLPPKRDWLDLPELTDESRKHRPYNGEPILLTPDGEKAVPAMFKKTRRFDGRAAKWVEVEIFVERNSGGYRIEFEPMGYRALTE